MAEVEEVCKKIQAMRGVRGLLIINQDGIPIKTSMSTEETPFLAYVVKDVIDHTCKCIKELDNLNELTFLRLHSRKNEIMVAYDAANGYAMVVVQEAGRCE